MRVRLLTDRWDTVRGLQLAGDELDLPTAEARRLLAARQAEAVAETAALEPPESAALRAPGRKAR